MPVRQLPPSPNLDHLKQQAKDLMKAHASRTLASAQLIREFHPRFRERGVAGASDAAIFAAPFKLSDAQLTIAREHGFPTWPRLKARIDKPTQAHRLDLPHHERIEDPDFRRAVDLIDAGDADGLRAWLKEHPGLARRHVVFEGMNYFHNPSLLEFIAENPIRQNRMAENIVEVTEVILESGLKPGTDQAALDTTLALVATGSVAAASGRQGALIDLLCRWGADAGGAIHAAVLHGELKAVQALIGHGATVDLPVAALGPVENFRRMLPAADARDRRLALAVASQYGRMEILQVLLDAGEDINRYNPVGGHSHCTPLHQAAGYGSLEFVRFLVERGARAEIKDVLWKGTPADWAHHEGRTEIEDYLRGVEGREDSPGAKAPR
jgi:hypothetical protein